MAETKKIATRESFGLALCELAKEHPEIVVLDADLDVGVCISDGIPDYLESSAGSEHCESGSAYDLAGKSKSRGGSIHVLFSYAHVEKSFRKYLCEFSGLCRTREIGIHYHQVGILSAQFLQGLTIGFPCCHFICH